MLADGFMLLVAMATGSVFFGFAGTAVGAPVPTDGLPLLVATTISALILVGTGAWVAAVLTRR